MSKATINLGKLRDLGTEELTSTLLQSRDELFRLRLGMQTNQVTSTAAVGAKRREIARIMTILNGRQAAAPAAAPAKATKKTTKSTKAKAE